jgi:hypothetical protein
MVVDPAVEGAPAPLPPIGDDDGRQGLVLDGRDPDVAMLADRDDDWEPPSRFL